MGTCSAESTCTLVRMMAVFLVRFVAQEQHLQERPGRRRVSLLAVPARFG